MSAAAPIAGGDLTAQEQQRVRAALKFLRARFGGWGQLAKAMKTKDTTLSNVAGGHKIVTPSMVFRVARLVQVGIDDLLAGRFPEPGTCPMCGHCKEGS